MQRPVSTAAALALLLALTPGIAHATDDSLVYPKLDCYSIVSEDEYVLYFGSHSNSTTNATPGINFFDPPTVVPPAVIPPGYTPRMFSVTADPSVTVKVIWFLGSAVSPLEIVLADLDDDQLCGIGLQGPQGEQGAIGPQGETGPSGLAGCRTVTATTDEGIKPAVAVAMCDSDEQVVSGEAACGKGAITSFGRVASGWEVRCQKPKGVTATALCCPQ